MGKAPGAKPLKECLVKIEGVLGEVEDGDKLKPIQIYDIICHLAEAVLSGGIRRSATICFFSKNDLDMRSSKMGTWWELNPQRGMANNSVVLERSNTTFDEFNEIWEYSKNSGSGEPGFVWTDNPDMCGNPCMEISLNPQGLCNLTEINGTDIEDEQDWLRRCWAASLIGTLQASYTDFYYLRDEWKERAEKEALTGVSVTGIASGDIFKYSLKGGAEMVKKTNETIAKLIGINPAHRLTAVKPAGTTSLVLGTSSGVHAYHSKFYKRRVRVNKDEAIYGYLKQVLPNILEDDWMKPNETAVITIPIKAPDGAVTRDESVSQLLDRVLLMNTEWVATGHVQGDNNNNVSATISVRDDEWDYVRDVMWGEKDKYTGMAILPHSDHTYKQAPFEDCTEDEYNILSEGLSSINLSLVLEETNNTNLQAELACSGGSCEII